MAAPPEVSQRAMAIIDTVVEVVTTAGKPLLWHEVVDGFYAKWTSSDRGTMHERTLYRHTVVAVKRGLIDAHGRSRARIYTAPGVQLTPRDKAVIYERQRGRRITVEDLL